MFEVLFWEVKEAYDIKFVPVNRPSKNIILSTQYNYSKTTIVVTHVQ